MSPEIALIASSRARMHRLTAKVIASTERSVRFTNTRPQTNQIYLLEESRGFNAPLHQHSSLSFPEDGLNSIPRIPQYFKHAPKESSTWFCYLEVINCSDPSNSTVHFTAQPPRALPSLISCQSARSFLKAGVV